MNSVPQVNMFKGSENIAINKIYMTTNQSRVYFNKSSECFFKFKFFIAYYTFRLPSLHTHFTVGNLKEIPPS